MCGYRLIDRWISHFAPMSDDYDAKIIHFNGSNNARNLIKCFSIFSVSKSSNNNIISNSNRNNSSS